ncbi:MAG TPA: histidine kinase dimerization/phospho-acceptor domain-containing protein, partial [Planctomycetaceae bacterium]|nr:histidine kinase dimerization/phospho-acceptor domain-containing protein [Planctomycetaceae bacterium]
MNRPWQIWISFGMALAIVAAGVGWLSFRALESDRAEAAARQQAALEEDVRVALWRMDTLMSSFVAQESARPVEAWRPFGLNPGGDNSRNRGRRAPPEPVPSPLLTQPLRQVLVDFERDAAGALTSPQVPTGPVRQQAVPAIVSADQVELYEKRLARLRGLINFDELLACLPVPVDNLTGPPPNNLPLGNNQPFNIGQGAPVGNDGLNPNLNNDQGAYASLPEQQEKRQQALGVNEFRRRSNYFAQNQSIAQAANTAANPFDLSDEAPLTATMLPRVVSGELILARTICVGGKTSLQGCWIDWGELRGNLLSEIADLLPQADLKLVDRPLESEQTRMLAALPVRLDPGAISASATPGLSPVGMALVFAWGAMLVAAVAVAVLLRGVVALSERRADFVSAVTHELRTPLTTFRMYAEMLAEGMVPDESARRKYLDTLRIEADRLTHLVENVLAYARLERGGLGNRIQPVRGEELLKLATGRLSERAREAGFALSISSDESAPQATVR